MQPWGANEVISCGGVLVRPGDAVVGDDDGVVVVPRGMVDEVIRIAMEREEVEEVIREELQRNPGSPGRYYPFNDATWKLYETHRRNRDEE
jgi:regulator of RNase E activity RraA